MIDERSVERAAERFRLPEGAFERLKRRRDRKRRNQRITAGVVGMAVFVAAVWIVTAGASMRSNEPSVVPGRDITSPAETSGPEGAFSWPPSEGVEPSTPASGELVTDRGGIHPWWHVQVFADGRVIWLNQNTTLEGWLERRLTPEGVDLVRSGTVELGGQHAAPGQALPTGAWEDAEWKVYIPSRYVACTGRETIPLLPQEAQDLLRDYTSEQAIQNGEVNYSAGGRGATCPTMTIREFRTLDQILLQSGWKAIGGNGTLLYEYPDLDTHPGFVGRIEVIGLLPDGTFRECCPG